jgi:hypothetical protein
MGVGGSGNRASVLGWGNEEIEIGVGEDCEKFVVLLLLFSDMMETKQSKPKCEE